VASRVASAENVLGNPKAKKINVLSNPKAMEANVPKEMLDHLKVKAGHHRQLLLCRPVRRRTQRMFPR
jgi:hypothetical protein